ncbi:MAG: DUF721 domain-containing protein [Cytophagales bacterium]|nr:DUF721 domain-containing protein [Cytophagales bacterium]MDW8383980.1 DUF721 domain-containing protein [Flammeovirgaceae bacterium]
MTHNENQRSSRGPVPISQVFEEFLKEINCQKTFQQKRLKAEWAQIVGHGIAQKTTELYFRGNRLYIKIASAPLRNELNMSKSELLKAIYSHFQEIIVDEIIIL